MTTFAERLTAFVNALPERVARNALRVMITAGIIAFVVLTIAVLMKWFGFDYAGLDLTIYNQVMWNTVHGSPFAFTIHPHPYLGDHLEFILLALTPIYAFFQHPLTLLILQNIALLSASWPMFLLLRRTLPRALAVLVTLGFIVSPFIWNTALYEFHALAFALPILCWLLVAYEARRYVWCILLSLLAMTVREDIALIVAGIGIVAIFERRSLRWSLPFILMGLIWFVSAIQISGLISGYGQYKYLVYYGHLGASFGEILKNIFVRPGPFFSSLFGPSSILFLLGFFLPVLYGSFLRPKWLLPLVLPALALILTGNNAEIVLRIHYPIALVPFLFLSLRDGLRVLSLPIPPKGRVMKKLFAYRAPAITLLAMTFLYSFVVMSPILGVVRDLPKRLMSERTRLLRAELHNIPPGDESVAAGYVLLPALSSRSTIVSLHYVFSGKQQFSQKAYDPPPVQHIIYDAQDVPFYHATNDPGTDQYDNGAARIEQYASANGLALRSATDGVLEWSTESAQVPLSTSYELLPKTAAAVNNDISAEGVRFIGWEHIAGKLVTEPVVRNGEIFTVLPLTLYWQRTGAVDDNRFFTLRLQHEEKTLWERQYPVAYGLYPPLQWKDGEIVGTPWEFLLPDAVPKDATLTLTVETLTTNLRLSSTNGVDIQIADAQRSAPFTLGTIYSPEVSTE